MTRLLKVLSVLLLLLFAVVPAVHAQGYDSPEIKTLEATEVIDRDYFIAGEQVEIYGTINGDLYVAGGTVVVDGVINGDVLAGGGDVRIKGEVTDDVRVAGGQVSISGNVGRNVTVAGGNIDFLDSATIAGSVVLAGGNASLASPVGTDVTAAVGNLNISSEIGRDVTAGVGTMRLAPDTIIGGNLTYYSEEEVNVAAGATVEGEVIKKAVPPMVAEWEKEMEPQNQAQNKMMGTLFSFLSTLLVGLILVKLYPRYLKSFSATLTKKPWAALGVGFLALIVTPLAILFLLITFIGIPLAMILLAAYILYIYLSKIFVSYWIGNMVMKRTKNKVSPYWGFVAGLALFTLLISIPVLKGFVWLATILFGLGAALLTCKKLYLEAREKELI